ncbi:DNA mismatch repair endonuclease MutL [Psychroflexus lacisalsi]|jgi:DNA mismatch repair protein MutL|uniref:DNA mismatch repair protein MutL n=1 Tax=Psychroflexus lacisalsi TaxID=503928 RepID=A0ABP3VIV5_9FLAO|nr:DNA mismatch repair endonuclease MutL [Psychroflexus lacisalsi]MBZ9619761.1 DNA mismatch repair endonuclease MutL [Psychroflexus lacisalsi]
MRSIIHLLPDHVANQIAAGEVVQRPASVVKELLENAVDAKATSVTLIAKEGGKTLIQVIDNGSGMGDTDARLSFERHATSKINSAEDLFRLHTKGFRGEALASIAAVSHVEMKTKTEDDDLGSHLIIEGSTIVKQEPCVTPVGTSLSVKNLFFNIPARRNFLKSTTVEQKHVIDEFQRVALVHPSIAFKLIHNGSELFNLPGANHRQRIVGVMGAKTNEKLVPVKEETDLIKLMGFVGKPEFAKKSRGEQFFFVNDRFIKHPYLHHAVSSAFEGLLKDKAYPSYFLYLQVDPKSIDINIHPTKTEVKFDNEHAIYSILRSSVKHSLGQFNVSPVLDFNKDSSMDTDYVQHKTGAKIPSIDVDRNFNPFESEQKISNSKIGSSSYKSKSSQNWESLYTETIDSSEDLMNIEVESEQVTPSLFQGQAQIHQSSGTFQLQRKYIITSTKSEMLIIDQHRAHFRILYEELLKNITAQPALSQQLLFPLKLQLDVNEMRVFKILKESLINAGFSISEFGKDFVRINGIPNRLPESETSILLDQLLSDFENDIPDSGFDQTDLLAKSLAQSMAIKNGTVLQKEEQTELVNLLFSCKEPMLTPLNRLVFVKQSASDFDKKFM